jgi:hypothetical protein
MHLIVRYHQPEEAEAGASLPSGQDWLPTWRIDGPDEPAPHQQPCTTLMLTGETRLPVLAAGDPLLTGEIYLDLRQPGNGPFRALEGQIAGHGNSYVAQGNLNPDHWNQLVRICARAGALVLDANRSGTPAEVTIVMEPISPVSTASPN